MNLMWKDNKKIVKLERDKRYKYVIYENGDKEHFSHVNYIKIKCSECNDISERIIKEKYFTNPLLCASCIKKGNRNPFYNKAHSLEFKERLRKERIGTWFTGDKNAMYGKSVYDIWINKYGKDTADIMWKEKSKNQSTKMIGENNPFYNKTHTKETIDTIIRKNKLRWLDSEYRKLHSKKCSDAQLKLFNKNPKSYREKRRKAAYVSNLKQTRYKKTYPELVFEGILNNNNIEYVYSPIIGKYQYDFKIKNKKILIEVDGDYWHGNPNIYKSLNYIQKKKQTRDNDKENFANKHNFKLYRIWSSDLNNTKIITELLNKIKE